MDSMREAKMLLPMEKLFMQILEEKKKSIIQQVKHQIDLFDHHLASKCLLQGIPPPPWLFPNHPSFSSNELQKEDIISGLLLPRANLYPSTQVSEKAAPVADDMLPTSLCTEVCGEKASVCVDRLSILPQLGTSGAPCVLNGAREVDVSVASPQVCWDAGVFEKSDANHIRSLAKIQRSKSRQRALELRSSAKRAKMCPRDASVADASCAAAEAITGDIKGNKMAASISSGGIMGLQSSNPHSSSEKEPLEGANASEIGMEDGGPSKSINRSTPPSNNVNEVLELARPFSAISSESMEVTKAKVGDKWSKENRGDTYSGRITRSRSSSQQASHEDEYLNFDRSGRDAKEEGKKSEYRSKEGYFDTHCKGFSRSSMQIRSKSKPNSAGNPSYIAKEDTRAELFGRAIQQPNHVHEVLEPAKASSVIAEFNRVVEESNTDDFKGKKHNTSIDTSEIMRVRTPLPNSLKELSDVKNSSCFAMEKNRLTESINRSALTRTPSVIAKETQEARKSNVGDEWSKENRNGRTTSSSSIQQPNHANNYLSLDSSSGSGKVEKEKMCECRSKEECCDAYCGRFKRSVCSNYQIMSVSKPGSASTAYCTGKEDGSAEDFGGSIQQPHHINEILELTKPSVIADLNRETSKTSIGGVKGEKMATSSDSRGIVRLDSSRPSPEPPQPLGLAGRGCVELQAELASKIDVLPSSTKGESAADRRIRDADVDFDGEVCSGSRPPTGCPMLMKPKLLDFDEECSFLPSTLLENINQRMSSEDKPSTLLDCTDLLDNIVSIDHQEDPNSSTETPVLEDHELASNDKKSLNESSEAFVNNCPFLIDENTIVSVQKNINLSTSLNQLEGMYPMGPWPQPECTKIGDQLTAVVSASPRPMKKLSQSLQADDSIIRMSPDEDIQNYKFRSWPQHECSKMGNQLTNALSASPRPMKKLSQSLQADNSSIRMSPVEDIHVNEKQQFEEGLEFSSQKLQVQQVYPSLEERDIFASTAYTPMQGPLGLLSESSFPIGVSLDDNQALLFRESGLDLGFSELLTDSGKNMQESKSHEGMNGNLSHFSVSPLQEKSKDLTDTNESMFQFEGFVIGADDEQPHITDFDKFDLSITTLERASLVEQLCKSACLHKSLSHVSTTYMNLYQSVPNGLPEGMELRSPLNINGGVMEQLAASSGCLNEEVNSAFHGGSQSECLPFSNVQSPWDIKKPYLSPAGKPWDRITSKSGSSEKRASSIPDLPCITEENENIDEVADSYQIGVCLEAMTSALKREPLADITKSTHPPTSVYEAEKHDDRHSLASVSTEFSFSGTCKRTRPKRGNQTSNKRRYVSSQKENQGISLEVNGVKRDTQSLRNRFSKPQLSAKPSLRKEGPSLFTREPKRNNIVSDVPSFIPLLQQKQEAEANKGKRDVKVKALEVAEAAKRREEKKEHEKKIQKQARLVERARIEELEKLRKEEERKRKEEAQKKKDAELAAKKRQREEEERKEKERKKKRVDETSKQQFKNKEKLHAEKEQKELKFKAAELKGKYGKHEKKDQATEENNIQKSEIETTAQALTIDTIKTVINPEEGEALHGCLDTLQEVHDPTESDKLTSNVIHEQSYDISPYKGSDDEDEDEDDVSNAKFIPSWGSKKNVAVLLASQQRIDPLSIFSPEDFYNITEVLLPRKFRAK